MNKQRKAHVQLAKKYLMFSLIPFSIALFLDMYGIPLQKCSLSDGYNITATHQNILLVIIFSIFTTGWMYLIDSYYKSLRIYFIVLSLFVYHRILCIILKINKFFGDTACHSLQEQHILCIYNELYLYWNNFPMHKRILTWINRTNQKRKFQIHKKTPFI
jgi:hypothetical protein